MFRPQFSPTYTWGKLQLVFLLTFSCWKLRKSFIFPAIGSMLCFQILLKDAKYCSLLLGCNDISRSGWLVGWLVFMLCFFLFFFFFLVLPAQNDNLWWYFSHDSLLQWVSIHKNCISSYFLGNRNTCDCYVIRMTLFFFFFKDWIFAFLLLNKFLRYHPVMDLTYSNVPGLGAMLLSENVFS